MNNDNLNKIGSLMDQKLEKFGDVMDEKINKALDPVHQKLDALSGDVEQLILDVKGIRDKEGMAHSRNKREIDEIKTHIGLPLIPDTPEI